MGQQHYLKYKKSTISYQSFGNGSQLVICLHGYGEAASHFSFLEKYAAEDYTFIAIDLPFHGQTEWNEALNFIIEDLQNIIEGITNSNNFKLQTPLPSVALAKKGDNKLSLLAFSLGGRLALHLYQQMPERINKLVLLAPDGLKVNCWYWLATQTWLGNKLFALTMRKPGWFMGLLKLLNRFKLINTSIYKFTHYYIHDASVRCQLYKRWTTLRKIKPNLPDIKEKIKENNTTVRLIYGKHDRIILSSVGEKFRKGIEKHCTLTIIPSGHQVLHEKHLEEIIRSLQ